MRLNLAVLSLLALLAVGSAQSPHDKSPPKTVSDTPVRTAGNLEVLSGTKGVDFGPYLSKLLQKVRTSWYNYIPPEARPPQLAAGVTSIEFSILPNGQYRGMRIVHGSGLLPLDRAAWGGVTTSFPLDPLPQQFKGQFLALRMHFYYNPEKLPPNERPNIPPASTPAEKPAPH
jgi:outer membrane biosynthesis protein TonB